MADIYVRPYGSGNKNPLRFLVPVLVIAAVLGGGIWWLISRAPADDEAVEEPQVESTVSEPEDDVVQVPERKPEPQPEAVTIPEDPTPTPVPTPRTAASAEVLQLFERAQKQFAAGKLTQAAALLEKVIQTSSDPSMVHNAIRVLGRVHMKILFTDVPSEFKASYVIQPGDSLDRIARNNHTTVELLRKMNNIDGNLIYPGARLYFQAAPFEVHVDKSARILDLTMNGKLFKRYSVGVGKYGKTPVGTFYTVVHQVNPDWTSPEGGIIKFGEPGNVLGTRWMSIIDESRPDLRGFGIHGTSVRTSIGEEASNGCIRMLNEDVEEVFMLIPRGTKVVIQE